MSGAVALSAPLLLCAICEQNEESVGIKQAIGPSCSSTLSASGTQDSLKDTICEISDRSAVSEGSIDCMRADGLLHYPPDADADVCVSCGMMYNALTARAHKAVCDVAFAAGVCCGQIFHMCGMCWSRMVGLYVP